MNIKCLTMSCLASLCISYEASAQEKLQLTLDKAIEIALAENPTMRVADKEIQLKRIADQEAWQALLPTVNADLALSHSIKVAEMRTSMGTFKMGMDGSTTAQGGVTVALPLFAPAIYQNMKMAKDDILLAQEKARNSRQDLVNQVTKAYYSALLSMDSHSVMERSLNTAKTNFNIVNQKYEVGKVSEFDKISADVQVRTVSSSVVSAQTGVKLALLRLKVLMGVTADVDVVINDSLMRYEDILVLPGVNGENEVENNSNLKQIDMNMKMLNHANKILNTSLLPTAAVSFTGQYQSMSNDDWHIASYNYSPSMQLAFSIKVPIFNASTFTKLRSNRVQKSQLMDTRENTKKQLNMAASSYRENMISTVAKLESDRESIKQAGKAVAISSKRYEVGRGTVLELTQSEDALTLAELAYRQSIYDYLTNKADLEYTLGRNY